MSPSADTKALTSAMCDAYGVAPDDRVAQRDLAEQATAILEALAEEGWFLIRTCSLDDLDEILKYED